MFLDDKGEKISKSIGNGISVDEWLRYAPPESLSLYMFQKPKSAKKLFFDIIPKNIDEYFSHLSKFNQMELKDKYNNPVWHIHRGNPPNFKSEITFNSLLNLVSVCNSNEKKVIWGFVNEYNSSLNLKNNPELDTLIQYAINYYNDFVLPYKKYLNITDSNKVIFEDLRKLLLEINPSSSSENIQTEIYEIGKKNNFENLRDFFKIVYQVLLGQEQGPRLGSFIKLYGIKKTIKLIDEVLNSA
jgi:lysyl-tRNA synthetase class 1